MATPNVAAAKPSKVVTFNEDLREDDGATASGRQSRRSPRSRSSP